MRLRDTIEEWMSVVLLLIVLAAVASAKGTWIVLKWLVKRTYTLKCELSMQ